MDDESSTLVSCVKRLVVSDTKSGIELDSDSDSDSDSSSSSASKSIAILPYRILRC